MNWLTKIFKTNEDHIERAITATILVVDASLIVRKTFEALFAAREYRLVCVADETKAHEQLRKVVPDVIFIDVGLAEQGGYHLCKFVKESQTLKNAVVFLLVPAFSRCDEELAKRAHADGWFTKPIESMKKIIETVKDSLARRQARASSDML